MEFGFAPTPVEEPLLELVGVPDDGHDVGKALRHRAGWVPRVTAHR